MEPNRKLESRVSSLETSVGNLVSEVRGIHTLLEDIRSRQAESQKTQWGPIIGSISVVITVIGLFLSGYGSNQKRIEHAVNRSAEALSAHMQIGGHKGMEIRVGALEKTVGHLDEVLQREMRLLDSSMDRDIQNLDVRLQREMELLDRNIVTRVDAIEGVVTSLRGWQSSHDQRVIGVNAEQSQRIKSLEREVFKAHKE